VEREALHTPPLQSPWTHKRPGDTKGFFVSPGRLILYKPLAVLMQWIAPLFLSLRSPAGADQFDIVLAAIE
jgi:hypothetical protein